MRLIAFLITLLVLCMGQARAVAAQDSKDSNPSSGVAADASAAQVELIPWAFIVRDDTGEKTVEEVMRTVVSDHQSSSGNEVFSVGFSKAAYWFVVPLENSQSSPLKRLLVLGFPEAVPCHEITPLSRERPIESSEPIEPIALATTMAV